MGLSSRDFTICPSKFVLPEPAAEDKLQAHPISLL